MKISPVVILSLVLLAEAMISRYLTGSALHLSLVLCAAAAYSILRLFGPATARAAGFGCAVGLTFGAWLLFDRGLVPISLSELPAVFHFAFGTHFLLWTVVLGARLRKSSRRKTAFAGTLEMPWLIAGIAAGAAVAWTTATVEIYSISEFLVRSLGFGVLAGSVLLGNAPPRGRTAGAVARTISGRRQSWRSNVFLVSSAIAVVMIAASLVPAAQGVAGRLYAWSRIEEDAARLKDFGGSRPKLDNGSGAIDQAGRELPRKADIELSDSLRFYLEADDAESFRRLAETRVYARTHTLSVFADDGRLAPLRSGEWRFDADDGLEDGRVRLANSSGETAGIVSYSVLIESRDSGAIPLVARPQFVVLGSVFAYADDWYQLALEEHQERVRFRARSAQQTVDELLSSDVELRSGIAPEVYRQLPPTALAQQVRAAGEKVAAEGGETLVTLLPRIRDWLEDRCSYSLSYDNPSDLTPIENFLFSEKKGHCELFAAGTVMLLRSLDIPARVAYGYCGGTSDTSKQVMAFRESDFHAWAEVYLDGHGWVIFETTPPGQGAVHSPHDQTGGSAFTDAKLAGYEFLGDLEPIVAAEVSGFSKWIRAVTGFATDWFFAICAGIFAIGSMIWFFRRRASRGQSGPESAAFWPGKSSGKRERPPDFLADYLRVCRGRGFEKKSGQTWREFLESLKGAGFCQTEFDDLTRYVYGIRYAGRERSTEEEQKFRESVKSFAEAQR